MLHPKELIQLQPKKYDAPLGSMAILRCTFRGKVLLRCLSKNYYTALYIISYPYVLFAYLYCGFLIRTAHHENYRLTWVKSRGQLPRNADLYTDSHSAVSFKLYLANS